MRRARPDARRMAVCIAAVGALVSVYSCSPEGPEGGLPTHPSDGFSVTLEWDAPTEDAVGRRLTDLAGYRLYYSPALPLAGPQVTRLEIGLETTATVEGLPAGRYFFGVTALDIVGNESDLSAPLEVEVGP